MAKQPIVIVWLKRDLRLTDHQALTAAVHSGYPVLICYCFEPWQQQDPHFAARHWRLVVQSLQDLQQQLQAKQQRLWVFACDFSQLLATLAQAFELKGLYSHREIGLANSWARDQVVARQCHALELPWQQFWQQAVRQGSQARKGWQAFAQHHWQQPLLPIPWAEMRTVTQLPDSLTELRVKQLPKAWLRPDPSMQQGGETQAWQRWAWFVQHGLSRYRSAISKPEQAEQYCSRMSAFLSLGNLSIRQLHQALAAHRVSGRKALQSRLAWHCHFMQKFESCVRMQFAPLNLGYLPLLQAQQQQQPEARLKANFQAWAQGRTGYPMVDACMRSLWQTGYLNFRLRAMLVSFACHHLALPWQWVAQHLARLFLDFEPGIHYPQIQMQVGLTGFNTLRIYNPVQQSLKQDPEGRFIVRYLPELADLPPPLRHQPWTMGPLERQWYAWPLDYPEPMVDHLRTAEQARKRLWQWRASLQVQRAVPELLAQQVD